MIRFLKFFFIAGLVLAIAACSSFHKKGADTKRNMYAENPNLITPKELSNFKTEDYYPIPKLPEGANKTRIVDATALVYPPGSGLESRQKKGK